MIDISFTEHYDTEYEGSDILDFTTNKNHFHVQTDIGIDHKNIYFLFNLFLPCEGKID